MSKICRNCWPICWFLKFSGQPVGHGKRSRIASGSVSIDPDSGGSHQKECWRVGSGSRQQPGRHLIIAGGYDDDVLNCRLTEWGRVQGMAKQKQVAVTH